MPVVKADTSLCQGYANCLTDAGDLLDLDDEGLVVVLTAHVQERERARVERAVQSCPVGALAVEDD
jgi:ferredoxin